MKVIKEQDSNISSQKVIIREEECIGCTKCIQACPYDAIIGTAKQMHTIILSACTGCELCISACPVDCIDIITVKPYSIEKAEERLISRELRIQRDKAELKAKHENTKSLKLNSPEAILLARKAAIAASVARTNAKKSLIRQREDSTS